MCRLIKGCTDWWNTFIDSMSREASLRKTIALLTGAMICLLLPHPHPTPRLPAEAADYDGDGDDGDDEHAPDANTD